MVFAFPKCGRGVPWGARGHRFKSGRPDSAKDGSLEIKVENRELVRTSTADPAKADSERSAPCHVVLTVAELVARYLLHVEIYYTKNGSATSQLTIVKLTADVLPDRHTSLEVREFGTRSLMGLPGSLGRERYIPSRGEPSAADNPSIPDRPNCSLRQPSSRRHDPTPNVIRHAAQRSRDDAGPRSVSGDHS